LWLVMGWSVALRSWVMTISSAPAIALALYTVGFAIPYMVINLPLSYTSGFALPHRFGQSNQSFWHWVGDQVKGLAISALLGMATLEIVYWLLRAAPQMWWLYAGGVMLLFTVVLSSLAPVLILPLFFKFTPLEDDDLSQRLIRLAERAGTRVRGVFRFDMSTRTKGANAALTGLGNTRRIVLGDTLLDEFTADEIETVLAHELGHHVHKDIPLGIVINSALTLLTFWVGALALRWGVNAFGLAGISDPAGLPLLALVGGLLSLIAMPLGNAYSRWRERLADRYALESTRKPTAFADAMTRLANQNLADADPARWVVILLYSHPPIRERLAAAEAFAVQTG
jgi:STE24 endopeptidase